MALLLRLLAVPVLLAVVRRQAAASPMVREVERLDWDRRAELGWRLMRDRRLPLWLRPLAMLPSAYTASPIDLLPDFIPFVGRLDDRFVSSTAFWLVGSFAPEPVVREHIHALRGDGRRLPEAAPSSYDS